jgi:hypothetical protein
VEGGVRRRPGNWWEKTLELRHGCRRCCGIIAGGGKRQHVLDRGGQNGLVDNNAAGKEKASAPCTAVTNPSTAAPEGES